VGGRPSQRAEQRRIAAEISRLGPIVPGTLLERSMRCRNAGCRCHADPPQLHGPYWFWTRKVNAKTVSQVLSAEQAAEYRSWFENERRLRELVHELEAIGISAIESDPRSPRRQRSDASAAVDEA
jgi:hypothetical protein